MNEETGNRRPVMLTVQRVPRTPKPTKNGSVNDMEREAEEGERERGKEEETPGDAGEQMHPRMRTHAHSNR